MIAMLPIAVGIGAGLATALLFAALATATPFALPLFMLSPLPIAIASYEGPVYLRFGRPKWPNFTPVDGSDFVIGKAQVLAEGTDISIFACGHMVWKAIEAGVILQEKGISVEVINIHTIKPLDTEAIIKSSAKPNVRLP